jgi:hypothetical protein
LISSLFAYLFFVLNSKWKRFLCRVKLFVVMQVCALWLSMIKSAI